MCLQVEQDFQHHMLPAAVLTSAVPPSAAQLPQAVFTIQDVQRVSIEFLTPVPTARVLHSP